MIYRKICMAIICACLSFSAGAEAWGQAKVPTTNAGRAPVKAHVTTIPAGQTAETTGEASEIERANKWTIGLAGGHFDGALQFAADIQSALADGDDMRVLTMIGRGSVQNTLDLLYMKGVDVAIISTDTFEEFKKENKVRDIENRIQYISQI